MGQLIHEQDVNRNGCQGNTAHHAFQPSGVTLFTSSQHPESVQVLMDFSYIVGNRVV